MDTDIENIIEEILYSFGCEQGFSFEIVGLTDGENEFITLYDFFLELLKECKITKK